MFDLLIHADWSVNARKRWAASAVRNDDGWTIGAPVLVGSVSDFLNNIFEAEQRQRVLLGFDFPVGVPAAYGLQTGFRGFRELLPALGEGIWSRFFDVARLPSEIAITRPCYPFFSTKGVSRAELVAGLGARRFDDLLRVCERRTAHRQDACSLFWTLGANQVGKGALTGWKEVIRPAILRGASLWPFDGDLAQLARPGNIVLAETYPAEAYHMVGAQFYPGQSKRQQADRGGKAPSILAWAKRHGVTISAPTIAGLATGFGSAANGEDQFDALMGLLKMVDVVDGRRPERTETHETSGTWEGWILGR